MSWTHPATLSQSFDTNDIPTEANFDSLFNNLLSLAHPLGSRETAEKGVQNSTAETSLYTAAPIIPAGTLGTTGSFHAFVSGRIRQGTTLNLTWTWKVKLGG